MSTVRLVCLAVLVSIWVTVFVTPALDGLDGLYQRMTHAVVTGR